MFEPIETSLGLLGMSAAVGFFLGVPYNIFRFVRIAFPKLKMTGHVLDFLFCVIAGLVLFIYSVEYGTGFFRLYYVFGAAFGFAVNMLTAGFLVPPLARLAGKACGVIFPAVGRILVVPVRLIKQKSMRLFGKISEITAKMLEKCKLLLQKNNALVYNSYGNKIGIMRKKGGEQGHVIKAKVRKIS